MTDLKQGIISVIPKNLQNDGVDCITNVFYITKSGKKETKIFFFLYHNYNDEWLGGKKSSYITDIFPVSAQSSSISQVGKFLIITLPNWEYYWTNHVVGLFDLILGISEI